MGLRHLVVLDGEHRVTGILTRHDLTEHRLEHHWFHEGDHMQKFIVVDPANVSHYIEPPGAKGDDASGYSALSERTNSGWVENSTLNSIQLMRHATNGSASTRGTYEPPVPPSHSAPQLLVPPPIQSQASNSSQSSSSAARNNAARKNLKEPKTMASV
jgi:hypothetical protein